MSDLVNLSSEEFVKSVIARGGKVSKTGFGGGTRPSANPLEIGDVFTIPEDFKAHVYELPIAGSTYKYQFLRLQVKNGDKTSYKQVGPSVFSRTVPVVDDSGEPTGEIAQAAGGAAEEFCKHGDYNEAFTAIAGKAIKVTDKKVVLTQSYRSDRPTNNTAIYTTEFVEGQLTQGRYSLDCADLIPTCPRTQPHQSRMVRFHKVYMLKQWNKSKIINDNVVRCVIGEKSKLSNYVFKYG